TFYDKTKDEIGWNNIGYAEDESWHSPISVERPRGEEKLCEAEPIRVYKELKPVSITEAEMVPYEIRDDMLDFHAETKLPEKPVPLSGGYLYDFGENNAGIFRLKIKGYKGQKIDFQCGEKLVDGKLDFSNHNSYPDGYCQRDIYIVGSDEEEIFEPMFTYHGFRYIYVYGITKEQATEDLLTYLVMSSDLPERGTFRCSDEMANTIYEMGRRSDRSNFYYFPTDCPHREKNGWTGDIVASAEHMMMTIGAEKSFREYSYSVRGAQRENGEIPGIIPTDTWGFEWGNGPGWDRILFELPYIVYKYRGEKELILENASAMMRYLEYVAKRRDERGIVEIGLGDWAPTASKAPHDYQAPLGFTDSTMVYWMCREAEEMFDAVGLTLNRDYAKAFGKEIKEAIRREYINFGTMMVMSGCQTAQAMAIFYDIFENGEKPTAFNRLMEIVVRDEEKFTSGYMGLRVICHVLSQFGESELAYRMITGTEFPSYGYYVNMGLTTVPECLRVIPDVSLNHHFLGDFVQWFMRYPAGLNVINHKRVAIRPKFIEKLDFAEATHILPDGEVNVKWHRDGEDIVLEVVCPDAVECEIELECGWFFKDTKKLWEKAGSGTYVIGTK
ncbi:MAG: family 78 glycoside hydrolase catalytic domain, partial [Clostridia bacterium]|nr:family 78 glycoside hydrolase catalytic domain [Clostridia bacterium]